VRLFGMPEGGMDLAQVDHESASVLLDSPSDAMDKPEHDVIVVGAGNPTLCAAGEMVGGIFGRLAGASAA
jgi:ribulose 1,5-bisphosphate synthetase/thiazole synthase